MIIPCGHRVLVKPDSVEKMSAGGIVLAVNEKQEKAATITGTIVSVGQNAWKGFDDGHPWAQVGDRVMYAKYGGSVVKDPDTGEELRALNDEDIICKIKESA